MTCQTPYNVLRKRLLRFVYETSLLLYYLYDVWLFFTPTHKNTQVKKLFGSDKRVWLVSTLCGSRWRLYDIGDILIEFPAFSLRKLRKTNNFKHVIVQFSFKTNLLIRKYFYYIVFHAKLSNFMMWYITWNETYCLESFFKYVAIEFLTN